MLNWRLISHPINWVTIFLMVFIGAMVLNLLAHPWHSGINAAMQTQTA